MLPLPEFEYLAPSTLDEAVSLLAEHGDDARLVAGGTDILPNMKHGLLEPRVLIGLTALADLDFIRQTDSHVEIGALTRLATLRDSLLLKARLPSLASAAGQIAGPQLQNMGTLGGNLCLDTRCVYINQSHFWRESLGYCLKKDGTACHVVVGGKNCVAANSSDSAPVLISLGAEVVLTSARGERTIPVGSLFKHPGDDHLTIAGDEILSRVRVPRLPSRTFTAYEKLRIRKSIDFPIFSCALRVTRSDAGTCTHFGMAANALGARPKDLSSLGKLILGQTVTHEAVEAIAQKARKKCVPLTNINVDPDWRRAMVPVIVRKLFAPLLENST